MNLVRFNPFSLVHDFDRSFDTRAFTETLQSADSAEWLPRVDVAERDDDVLIRAELPGVDPETVDITLDGQVLTIKGAKSLVTDGEQDGFRRREIYEGSFRRSIRLPFAVDPATVSASASNGILEIIVPRQEQPSAHKIAVTVV